MTLPTLHIGIVSDDKIRIKSLQEILLENTQHQLDWETTNAINLLDKSHQAAPNLILIDISCDSIDGVSMTKEILAKFDTEVLLFSSSVSDDAPKVFEAMGYGALDVITLSDQSRDFDEVSALLKKIKNVCKLLQPKSKLERSQQIQDTPQKIKFNDTLITIGSSTGGPAALVEVLNKFPKDLEVAVVIIQHVDAQFAETLAQWLDEQIVLPVRVARNGDYPQRGTVLLAATNDHLCMKNDMSMTYQVEPAEYSYRPSIDVFFNSATQFWKGNIIGVLLTGMGRDGAIGLRSMRDRGLYTIAQDENSSVVFGMPKAAIELDAACKVMDIKAIGDQIVKLITPTIKTKKRTG